MEQVLSVDQALSAEHLFRLRSDHNLYCEVALKIQTKAGTLEPMRLNFAQRFVNDRIEEQKALTGKVRVLVLKARQEGISTLAGSRIFKGTTLWGNRRGAVVADKSERAGDIFAIYERFRDHTPPELIPPKKAHGNQRAREMWFRSDSRITVETAGDSDVGRGSTLHYLHLSELALWENADEGFMAVMEAVPEDGGEVIVEFTAKGIGNLAHRLWLQAEAGDSDWIAIFLPWFIQPEYARRITDAERTEILATVDPWERNALDEGFEFDGVKYRLTPEQLAFRRAKIRNNFQGDERKFRQEYPSTAREAFVASGDIFFDEDSLLLRELLTKDPLFRCVFVQTDRGFKMQRTRQGYIRVWEMPDPDGHYVAFADTAEGRQTAAKNESLNEAEAEQGGRDYSCADIWKVSEVHTDPNTRKRTRVACMRQVVQIHGYMAPEVFAQQIHAATALWSCPGFGQERTVRRQALTAIERNHSSGQTVIRVLDEVLHHRNLFRHRRVNISGNKVTNQLGWVTDGTTRQLMLDDFAGMIRGRESGLEINSEGTIREAFTFVRGDDGKPAAQEGSHDDRIISGAGALQMMLHHRCSQATGKAPATKVYDTPTGL